MSFLVLLLLLALPAAYTVRHIKAVERVERDWQASRVERLADFGDTRQLSITPLVNWPPPIQT